MTTTSGVDPRMILLTKREAELSGPPKGRALVRSEPPRQVSVRDRSVYSPTGDHEHVPLGMGYVQAMLSILHGLVTTYSYDPPGQAGRLIMRSLSRDTGQYTFTWNESAAGLLMGGFTHEGQPTFHAAVIALVELDVLFRCGERAQSQEVVQRWYELVKAMEDTFTRADPESGWERWAIEQACRDGLLLGHIAKVCDALHAALDWVLPDKEPRSVSVLYADAIEMGEGTSVLMPGYALLDPTYVPRADPHAPKNASSRTVHPVALPSTLPAGSAAPGSIGGGSTAPGPSYSIPPPAAGGHSTSGAVAGAATSTVPAGPPHSRATAPTTSPTAPATAASQLGPHYNRIRMAVLRGVGQPIMLEGQTGVGKTLLALEALLESKWGIELLTLHPGWKEEQLYGSYVRRTDDDWRLVPGPLTRFASRVIRGEQVGLVLDELGRAEDTIRDLLIDLLNVHSKAALLAMNAPDVDPVVIPDGEEGPFFLLNSPMTQNRVALPVRRVRIIATANQGERYQGAEWGDDAFFRRFPNWLYLKPYEGSVVSQILGKHLELPSTAKLIEQIQVVERLVVALQKVDECLRTLLYLPTLINWGKSTLWFFRDAHSSVRGNLGEAFLQAAIDTWLHQVCPYAGAELDPDVENKLLGYVTSAAPARIN